MTNTLTSKNEAQWAKITYVIQQMYVEKKSENKIDKHGKNLNTFPLSPRKAEVRGGSTLCALEYRAVLSHSVVSDSLWPHGL